MTPPEIRDLGIRSAKRLLKWMVDNDKGLQEVTVRSIELAKDSSEVFKIKVAAKLFSEDSIFFKVLSTGLKYDTSRVKILAYDRDQNLLIVKPKPELQSLFAKLTRTDFLIVSDLRFLVEQVEKWYTQNGSLIALPSEKSKLTEAVDWANYLPDFSPSPNQQLSLNNIFTNPLSYVWGAPGTGKTQYVLAFAALRYLRASKKIAVIAPTNFALEQVLNGVITMTDKEGVDRKKIIRLGSPSRTFADKYPEVCEERGVQKQLDELDKQIRLIEDALSAKQEVHSWQSLLQRLKRYDEDKKALLEKQQRLDDREAAAQEKLKRKKADLDHAAGKLTEHRKSKTTLVKKKDSFWTSFFPGRRRSIAEEIDILEQKMESLERNETYYKNEYATFSVELTTAQNDKRQNLEKLKQLKLSLSVAVNTVSEKKTDEADLEDKIPELIKFASDETDKAIVKQAVAGGRSEQELRVILQQLEKKRKQLAERSTKERLKTVQIMACTLDAYINRFMDAKMEVDHIFVDEAGYANLVKVLTLFNHRVPITLLGDHMQLPPVCEVNDSLLENDEEFHCISPWAQAAIYVGSAFEKTENKLRLHYIKRKTKISSNTVRTELTETFRFGHNLARVLHAHVYKFGFSSRKEEGENTQIQFFHCPRVPSPNKRHSSNEVDAISMIAPQLEARGEEYVILTPYNNQRYQIGRRLPAQLRDEKILTVHKAQGQEWDTVILSVVDTGDMFFTDTTLLFSNGLNLINTAVSRAKKRLIVVCDCEFWQNRNGQMIQSLLAVGERSKL